MRIARYPGLRLGDLRKNNFFIRIYRVEYISEAKDDLHGKSSCVDWRVSLENQFKERGVLQWEKVGSKEEIF